MYGSGFRVRALGLSALRAEDFYGRGVRSWLRSCMASSGSFPKEGDPNIDPRIL